MELADNFYKIQYQIKITFYNEIESTTTREDNQQPSIFTRHASRAYNENEWSQTCPKCQNDALERLNQVYWL